jgi:UDP-N-acetyl-D-glucosamine dehydrogenase
MHLCLPTSYIYALYSASVEKTIPASSTKVAESAKPHENIYRAVNIALESELKVLFAM